MKEWFFEDCNSVVSHIYCSDEKRQKRQHRSWNKVILLPPTQYTEGIGKVKQREDRRSGKEKRKDLDQPVRIIVLGKAGKTINQDAVVVHTGKVAPFRCT